MSLPGIDTAFGLATAMHRDDLYRRLLLKFREGQGAFADLFAKARGASDPTAAERCAHTLRGSAANLGAMQVQEAAESLERAYQQQAPEAQINDLLRRVLEELQPVMEGLHALDGQDTSVTVPSPVAVDAEKLATLRARLLELLDLGDARALEVCEEHEDLFRAAYPEQWKKISNSVQDFDFDSAMALIQQTT